VDVVTVFTDAERTFLRSQRLARIATASPDGLPDVSAVGFSLDGDDLVTGGFDITRTVRYRQLLANPRAAMVVDELVAVDPWTPRGVKVRGVAVIEEHGGGLRIRLTPEVVWSWGINVGAEPRFRGVERRDVGPT
jgi:pyridoxamine 5'-phosphate oxidase family protein